MPKLRSHILPRIKEIISKDAISDPDAQPLEAGLSTRVFENNTQEHDSVLFKDDRMYSHHLARFNYTTYDIRRAQDVINPGTSHRDIMLLANTGETGTQVGTDFLYARVLGVYHVNVVYTGDGMPDYNARKVYFLWVRWFEYDDNGSVSWDDFDLDSIRFPPMANEDAFGFVDPRDVLRACHVIPAFAKGKLHSDGVGLSRCACDAEDWACYRVNRYVTQPFLMIPSHL